MSSNTEFFSGKQRLKKQELKLQLEVTFKCLFRYFHVIKDPMEVEKRKVVLSVYFFQRRNFDRDFGGKG